MDVGDNIDIVDPGLCYVIWETICWRTSKGELPKWHLEIRICQYSSPTENHVMSFIPILMSLSSILINIK